MAEKEAAKKKAPETLEATIKELSLDRVKSLKGLGRKDREKIANITVQYNQDVQAAKDLFSGLTAELKEKAKIDAAAKKKADASAADEKAAKKQKKAKK